MRFQVVFSRQAQKDAKKLKRSNFKRQTEELIGILKLDPFQNPPRYESLSGNLQGCFSRRINIKHRLVYEVIEDERIVHVLRMWTHYGE